MNKIKRNNKLLLVIVIIAFYLRLQGINYGLPYVLNSEESANLVQMLGFWKNIFRYLANPESINVSPVFLFFNGIIAFITTHTFNLINVLEINPGSLLIPLRVISVLFSVASIVVIYFMGLRFSPFVAAVSSGLLSVSMIHIKLSQMFLPFSAMIFFGLLSVFFALKENHSDKDANRSIFSAFLSFLIHPIGILNIIPIFIVLVQKKSILKHKKLFFKIFVASLLLNLNLFFHLPSLVIKLFGNYFLNYHYNSYFLYAFSFLLLGIGPIAYLGSMGLLKYRNDYDFNLMKILFSLPLLCIGILGFLHCTKSEYAILSIPYFCIAAGLFFNSLYERAQTDNKKLIFILLLLFLFWIPLKYTLKYNKIINLSDTRVIATEWIKQNTSEDYKIAWDKNSIQLSWHDAYNKEGLKSLVTDPEVLINKQRIPVSLKLLEKKKDWFKILRKKVDYVVVNSLDSEMVFRHPQNELGKRYYKRILKLEPEIVFNPYLKDLDKNTGKLLVEDLYAPLQTLWQRERGGPVIKIYKL